MSDFWSDVSVQHPLATYLQKPPTTSQRGLALQSHCQCPNQDSQTPQSIQLTKALSSEHSGLAFCVKILGDETVRGAQNRVDAGDSWLLASALTLASYLLLSLFTMIFSAWNHLGRKSASPNICRCTVPLEH